MTRTKDIPLKALSLFEQWAAEARIPTRDYIWLYRKCGKDMRVTYRAAVAARLARVGLRYFWGKWGAKVLEQSKRTDGTDAS